MRKLPGTDTAKANLDRLAALFPSVIRETCAPDGRLTRTVDYEALAELLGAPPAKGNEFYEFTWSGKREARAEAARAVRKTLRPCPEESLNWETTENLYIEGDNLDVLKLLQPNYSGKVDLIYIDPPYNTGNDFIYPDSFRQDAQAYKLASGEITQNPDGKNNRLVANTRANGRFHSDWCSMIYPRLLLARNLLADDGLIFMSCDDNERENLKKICDEVFGEENYLNHLAWVSNLTGRQIAGQGAARTWESILVYSKNINCVKSLLVDINFARQSMPDSYKGFKKQIRKDTAGAYAIGDTLYNHNRKFNEQTRPNLVFSIFYNQETGELLPGEIGEHKPGFIEIKPHPNGDGVHKFHAWRWSREKIVREAHNLLVLPTNARKYEIYTKTRAYNTTLLKDIITNIPNGDSELQKLFSARYFDYPKSVALLKLLINSINKKDAIILDFFAGSSTTAHATMQLNAEDGGRRKFIMAQLPEVCAPESEAAKAGYANICEIGKERIRRAGEKIKRENPQAPNNDTGFRVLKCDTSNMKDVYYAPAETGQERLTDLVSNIREDRSDADLFFGCVLDLGFELSLPHETRTINGHKAHFYNGNELVCCFAENIDADTVRAIAATKPQRAVFRDSSFSASAHRINIAQHFREISPDTEIRVL